MSSSRNIREIQRVIDDLGLTACATIKHSAKSIVIHLVGLTGSRKVFAPCTPSDCRNFQNLRRDMKRVAQEIGLVCTKGEHT